MLGLIIYKHLCVNKFSKSYPKYYALANAVSYTKDNTFAITRSLTLFLGVFKNG